MSNLLNEIFLNETKIKFLCAASLQTFDWNSLKNCSPDEQVQLLAETVNSSILLNYPIKLEYQQWFLKRLVEKLESTGSEIHDDVYSALGRLMSLSTQSDYTFKHYLLNDRYITLKENTCLISNGTTGLRTWQASVALAEWIVQNDIKFQNKTTLELGSGIGLTGLITVLKCRPKAFHFTDCHDSVLKLLCENIVLNLQSVLSNEYPVKQRELLYKTTNHGVAVVVSKLPWEEMSADVCSEIGNIDLVLAADVIYDEALFGPLVQAMTQLRQSCNVKEFILSSTVRNENTLQAFINKIGQYFVVTETQLPSQTSFVWSTESPIKIFVIK